MNQHYSNSCTFNRLVLKVVAQILLRSTAVPRMVTSFTSISKSNIRTKLTWTIKKLKPCKSSIPWHIVVTEQDLILRNIIKGLQRLLLSWNIMDLPMNLMSIIRFKILRLVFRITPQSGTILTRGISGIPYQFPKIILINS